MKTVSRFIGSDTFPDKEPPSVTNGDLSGAAGAVFSSFNTRFGLPSPPPGVGARRLGGFGRLLAIW